ncbi:dual specificity phosphatase [Seiridium cupressi]
MYWATTNSTPSEISSCRSIAALPLESKVVAAPIHERVAVAPLSKAGGLTGCWRNFVESIPSHEVLLRTPIGSGSHPYSFLDNLVREAVSSTSSNLVSRESFIPGYRLALSDAQPRSLVWRTASESSIVLTQSHSHPFSIRSSTFVATMNVEYETRGGAVPAAPYAARPPSPPAIMIPAPNFLKANEPIVCVPSFANIDPQFLSAPELEIITQNRPQQAYDSVNSWAYEDRRKAQEILDFLWLGPSSVARDKDFLQKNGFTMLLAARDARMAQARLMGVDRVAKELGVHADTIDVQDHQDLIRSLPDAVRKINNHMLDVYRSQSIANQTDRPVEDGAMVIDKTKFRRGKVLIFCETGNDRSAGVVIAYLMSVFGMNMIQACQFIQFRRFCVSLDEDMKYLLQTYEGIIHAQKTVNKYKLQNSQLSTPASVPSPITPNDGLASALPILEVKAKRGIEETLQDIDDDDMEGAMDGFELDRDRYTDRPAFVPFMDRA